MTRTALHAAALGLAASAAAQPATQFRFANGTNQITVAPGTAVPVSLYAVGMPNIGSNIPWTTPPGTGQMGQYAGFVSALMDAYATGGTWSGLTIPPGYQGPPFGSPGTASGSSVLGINTTVGFAPPITGNQFILWQGTITVGSTDVTLDTLILGKFGNVGFEVLLSGVVPFPVTHYLPAANGTAVIHVPAPATLPTILGCLTLLSRRRRDGR